MWLLLETSHIGVLVLQIEVQVIVSHLMWVQGTELGFPKSTTYALNC